MIAISFQAWFIVAFTSYIDILQLKL